MSSSTLIAMLSIALLIASGHTLPTGLVEGALGAEAAVGPLAISAGANVGGSVGEAGLKANLGGAVGPHIGGVGGSVTGALGTQAGGILRPLANFVHNVGNLFNEPLLTSPPVLNGAGMGVGQVVPMGPGGTVVPMGPVTGGVGPGLV